MGKPIRCIQPKLCWELGADVCPRVAPGNHPQMCCPSLGHGRSSSVNSDALLSVTPGAPLAARQQC